jgi:DNA-binding IscR family transcriptional regulator
MKLGRESEYAIEGLLALAKNPYALARRAKDIKVKDILLAIEGPDLFDRCIFWSDRCADADPCRMHARWKPVRQQVMKMMEQTTLADLIKDRSREAAKG